MEANWKHTLVIWLPPTLNEQQSDKNMAGMNLDLYQKLVMMNQTGNGNVFGHIKQWTNMHVC